MSTKAYKIRHLGVWIIIFDRNPIKAYVLQKFFSLCLDKNHWVNLKDCDAWCWFSVFLAFVCSVFAAQMMRSFKLSIEQSLSIWMVHCYYSKVKTPFSLLNVHKVHHLWKAMLFLLKEKTADFYRSANNDWFFVMNRHLCLRSLLMNRINHNEFRGKFE